MQPGISFMGVSLIALGGAVLLASLVGGVMLLIGWVRRLRERAHPPGDFPAAVCQQCAASIPVGKSKCPACGHTV